MSPANELSYRVPFTSKSSLAAGFYVSASLGGGAPHAFLVDTGSVGMLAPGKRSAPIIRTSILLGTSSFSMSVAAIVPWPMG